MTLASGIIMLVLGAVLLSEQLFRSWARHDPRLRNFAAAGATMRGMYHSVKEEARPSAVNWMIQRLS